MLASMLCATFSAPVFSGSPPARAFQRTDRSEVLAIVIINANPHVKPYLPRDVSGKDVPEGQCDPDGKLNPRNNDGTCYDISSSNGTYRFRTAIGSAHGAIESIFKKNRGGKLVLWARFDSKNYNALLYANDEAIQYARINGNTDPTAKEGTKVPERNATQDILDAMPKDALQRALGIIGGKGR